jgi:hypothetical protein
MKKLLLSTLLLFAICSSQAQTLLNAGFEDWRASAAGTTRPLPVQAPLHWFGGDSLIIGIGQAFGSLLRIPDTVWKTQLYPDSAHHAGYLSAKLVTEDQDTLGIFPGLLTNAKANVEISFTGASNIYYTGGTKVTAKPTTVSAWVKYAPARSTDSGFLTVQCLARLDGVDSVVGQADVRVGGTDPDFRQITANIKYIAYPWVNVDTIRITFGSSYGSTSARAAKSTLYVDDVSMTTVPQSVTNVASAIGFEAYPNPANASLALQAPAVGSYSCRVMSLTGELLQELQFADKATINTASIASGIYYYLITDANKNTATGLVTIQH